MGGDLDHYSPLYGVGSAFGIVQCPNSTLV